MNKPAKNKNPANGLEKNTLSAEDIVALIKTSAENGITSLKFGGLELDFGPKKPVATATTSASVDEKTLKEQQDELLLERELSMRQEQVDNMLVEDPVKAEELIAQGELVPDDDGRVDPDDDSTGL